MDTYADHGINIQYGQTGEVRTICPECSQHRKKSGDKCLAVNTDKGTWICHHCGYAGGLKQQQNDRPIPMQTQKKTFTRPTAIQETKLPDKVVTWFEDRGISDETLYKAKIGYGPIWMPQKDKEVTAIQFPYFDGAEIINIKYRDGEKNFRMVKGAERVLYGLNDISGADTVIWVEGEIDKLSLLEVGIPNCVSVPDGAPTPSTKNYSSKFSFLESAQDRLEQVKRHIIAVDADGPGVRLKIELIRRLGAEKCYTVEWPAGRKDANEVLVSDGPDVLKRCIDAAKPEPIAGVFCVGDFCQDIYDTYEHGYERGESTGWRCVDEFYTVRVREWSVVTGIPGHGKSEWLDALMVNLAVNEGWRFGVCSMENFPLARHAAKLIEKYSGMPFQSTIKFDKIDRERLEKSTEWLNDHFFFIAPEEDFTVDGVLGLARALVSRYGINGLVIDPWNELDHSWDRADTETRYISAMLSKIRRFARINGVHVWVVAHPTKLQKQSNGQYPVPTPYDISGAAHWRNKADNAIAVYRPIMSDPKDRRVEIYVQKIRFKEIGQIGCANLQYDWVTGRYHE